MHRETRRFRVDRKQKTVRSGQSVRESSLAEHHRSPGLANHQGEARFRIVRVERHVPPAGFQHSEQCDEQLDRTFHAHADQHAGTDPARTKLDRELVGPCVEFAIRQRFALTDDRAGVRRAVDLLLHEVVNRPVRRERCVRRIHGAHRPLDFRRRQQWERPVGGVRRLRRSLEQHAEVFGHARHRPGVEEIGVVLERDFDAALGLREMQRQVDLRRRWSEAVEFGDRQFVEHQRRRVGVLDHEARPERTDSGWRREPVRALRRASRTARPGWPCHPPPDREPGPGASGPVVRIHLHSQHDGVQEEPEDTVEPGRERFATGVPTRMSVCPECRFSSTPKAASAVVNSVTFFWRQNRAIAVADEPERRIVWRAP